MVNKVYTDKSLPKPLSVGDGVVEIVYTDKSLPKPLSVGDGVVNKVYTDKSLPKPLSVEGWVGKYSLYRQIIAKATHYLG